MMDLNFIIGRFVINEKEGVDDSPSSPLINVLTRVNKEYHAEGKELEPKHVFALKRLIGQQKLKHPEAEAFRKAIKGYKVQPEWKNQFSDSVKVKDTTGSLKVPTVSKTPKEKKEYVAPEKPAADAPFADQSSDMSGSVVLGGGKRLSTGGIHGGMLRLTKNIHTKEGTGLADPGGVLHPSKFLVDPMTDTEGKTHEGHPIKWFTSAIYSGKTGRLKELSTLKYPHPDSAYDPKDRGRSAFSQEYRDFTSDKLNDLLTNHKIEGKTLRQHKAELPDTPEGHKTFQHHAGTVVDELRKVVYKQYDITRQRGVLTNRTTPSGEPIQVPERHWGPPNIQDLARKRMADPGPRKGRKVDSLPTGDKPLEFSDETEEAPTPEKTVTPEIRNLMSKASEMAKAGTPPKFAIKYIKP
jgi:hypothetical protein